MASGGKRIDVFKRFKVLRSITSILMNKDISQQNKYTS